MVSLKWGDVLSTVLPGSVAVFAVAPMFPPFWALVVDLNNAGLATGIAFLFSAAIAGGFLEGITRVTWDRWITSKCKPHDALTGLNKDNLELYERGVQSSYKYVTFYANLAWAVSMLLVSYMLHSPRPNIVALALLIVSPAVLLDASFVQWTYFVTYQKKVFPKRSDNAEERPATGNTSEIRNGRGDAHETSQSHGDSHAGEGGGEVPSGSS